MSEAREPVVDCWMRIGVRGDRSCPELQRLAHCRNCPVHSAAAKTMLNRPAQEAEIAAANERFAQPVAPPMAGGRTGLMFRVGKEWLALPCALIAEVADSRPIRSLPHRRSGALLGVVNVRGELVVCLSMAVILAIAQDPIHPAAVQGSTAPRLLVINARQGRLACPVDEVHGVIRYHESALEAPPAALRQAESRYTLGMLGWEDRGVAVLDDELLLYTMDRSLA